MTNYSNKLPLAKAKKWASRIVEILEPHCERIEIAGSVRRQKPLIGDIEIVCIPKRDFDMFGAPTGVCADFSQAVEKWEKVRGDADGRYTQRILPNTNGLTVDIFMADTDNWGWIFPLRTGSAVYAQKTFRKAYVGSIALQKAVTSTILQIRYTLKSFRSRRNPIFISL